jgi:hypothetical protein
MISGFSALAEGIRVRVNSAIVGVEKQGNSIVAKVESSGMVSQIAGTHMLVATGRRPNTDDLGLERRASAQTREGISRWTTSCVLERAANIVVTTWWEGGDCWTETSIKSSTEGLSGGPGRTRTSNQAVMSR